jgi:hypothetical protein
MTLRSVSLSCALGLGLPAPAAARSEDHALEARAEQRYRDADRWTARDRTHEAATAYLEAGQLFLDAAGSPKVALPLARLHRRALSALRRAAVHLPAARGQLAALCAQLSADTAGRVALPSACNLPPEPPATPTPAPEFITPRAAAEPVSAPSPPPPPETFPVALQILPRQAARRGVDVQWDAGPQRERLVGSAGRWQLPRGAHAAEIHAPGFERTIVDVMVGPVNKVHDVRLRRSSRRPRAHRPRRDVRDDRRRPARHRRRAHRRRSPRARALRGHAHPRGRPEGSRRLLHARGAGPRPAGRAARRRRRAPCWPSPRSPPATRRSRRSARSSAR